MSVSSHTSGRSYEPDSVAAPVITSKKSVNPLKFQAKSKVQPYVEKSAEKPVKPQPMPSRPPVPSTRAVAIPDSNNSALLKQIEDFHKLKNEIEDDLQSCLDEIESAHNDEGEWIVNLPDNFDEVVEMAVEEERNKQEEEEYYDEDGNPFW